MVTFFLFFQLLVPFHDQLLEVFDGGAVPAVDDWEHILELTGLFDELQEDAPEANDHLLIIVQNTPNNLSQAMGIHKQALVQFVNLLVTDILGEKVPAID